MGSVPRIVVIRWLWMRKGRRVAPEAWALTAHRPPGGALVVCGRVPFAGEALRGEDGAGVRGSGEGDVGAIGEAFADEELEVRLGVFQAAEAVVLDGAE